MSDDPYRSTKPRIVKTHGICLVLEQLVAVVMYSTSVKINLKSGEEMSMSWTVRNAEETVRQVFKDISDALEEYHR